MQKQCRWQLFQKTFECDETIAKKSELSEKKLLVFVSFFHAARLVASNRENRRGSRIMNEKVTLSCNMELKVFFEMPFLCKT